MTAIAVFISLLPVIVIDVLFLLGLVLLVRGIRGEADLSFPTCAACQYDLRGRDLMALTACPECGHSLTEPRAVLFGRYRRRPRMAMVGLVMIFVPIMLVSTWYYFTLLRSQQAMQAARAQWTAAAAANTPMSVVSQTTAELLQLLSQDLFQPWVWNELMTRHETGHMDDGEVAAVVDLVITYLQGQAALSAPFPSREFIAAVIRAQRVTPEQLMRLIQASGSRQFEVKMRRSVRSTALAGFTIRSLNLTEIPGLATLISVDQVLLDGDPIEFSGLGGRDQPVSAYGAGPLSGQFNIKAEPGPHQLTFCVGVRWMEEQWRAKTWSRENPPPFLNQTAQRLNAEVEILPVNETVVKLRGDDPELAQSIRRSIRVRELRLSPVGRNLKADLFLTFSENSPVLLSFDVFIVYDGREVRLGCFNAGQALNPRTRSGPPLFITHLSDFPDSIESVDVVLRPNVLAVERLFNIDEIWGEEIVYENVPVVRE